MHPLSPLMHLGARGWRRRHGAIAAEERRRPSSSEHGHLHIEWRGRQRKARPARRFKTGSHSDGDSAGGAGEAGASSSPADAGDREPPSLLSLLIVADGPAAASLFGHAGSSHSSTTSPCALGSNSHGRPLHGGCQRSSAPKSPSTPPLLEEAVAGGRRPAAQARSQKQGSSSLIAARRSPPTRSPPRTQIHTQVTASDLLRLLAPASRAPPASKLSLLFVGDSPECLCSSTLYMMHPAFCISKMQCILSESV
jgi:hypothetical protein